MEIAHELCFEFQNTNMTHLDDFMLKQQVYKQTSNQIKLVHAHSKNLLPCCFLPDRIYEGLHR